MDLPLGDVQNGVPPKAQEETEKDGQNEG